MTRAEAIEILSATPQKMGFLCSGLTDDQMRIQLSPDAWSIKVIVGHMNEAEKSIFHQGLRRIKKESNPTLDQQNPDEWAEHFDDGVPIEELIGQFSKLRLTTIKSLNGLPEEDWGLPAVHPERGPTSMEGEVVYMAQHDMRHLSRLAALRKVIMGSGSGGE
jgi:hypothetical protein